MATAIEVTTVADVSSQIGHDINTEPESKLYNAAVIIYLIYNYYSNYYLT
jgi:hypothetical protein